MNSQTRACRRRLRRRQPCSADRSVSTRYSTDRSAPAERASNVLDGEEMKRFEKAAVVFGFPAARGRHARNTVSVCAQSSSSILVDMRPGLQINRRPINHAQFNSGIPKSSTIPNSSTQPQIRALQFNPMVAPMEWKKIKRRQPHGDKQEPLNAIKSMFPSACIVIRLGHDLIHCDGDQPHLSLSRRRKTCQSLCH